MKTLFRRYIAIFSHNEIEWRFRRRRVDIMQLPPRRANAIFMRAIVKFSARLVRRSENNSL